MTWGKEREFRDQLARVEKRASKEGLEALADLAVEEDIRGEPLLLQSGAGGRALCGSYALMLRRSLPRLSVQSARPRARPPRPPPASTASAGYKHVCALLLKDLKSLKPQYRLRAFYALSAIVRKSVARRGAKDKYGERRELLALSPGAAGWDGAWKGRKPAHWEPAQGAPRKLPLCLRPLRPGRQRPACAAWLAMLASQLCQGSWEGKPAGRARALQSRGWSRTWTR